MFTVILTGGIGSGKTAASQYFAELGVPLIDADIVSRELVEPGSAALQQIVEVFGTSILTEQGALNRSVLRGRIFQNPAERKALEAIMHPLIRQSILQQRAEVSGPYVVLVIPLWTADQTDYPVNRVLMIDVPEEVQISRVQQRDQIGTAAVERMLASQSTRVARIAAADDIILNTGTLAELQQAVRQHHIIYIKQAAEYHSAYKLNQSKS
jgi:dephospho-CoA kinase